MTDDTRLPAGEDAFPLHMFDSFDLPPVLFEERIGGAVMVMEKSPDSGSVVVMTVGVSRLPTDSGEKVELAVECIDGQQGAALVALRIVCDDIATNRRIPPVGSPWRNSTPFLNGTQISAILATGSRWGADFDDVKDASGAVVGHVRTLRMLTDDEAAVAGAQGWDALVEQAGGTDALLDVTRASAATAAEDAHLSRPAFVTKLHAEHPPRWITFHQGAYECVTGLETEEYMGDSSNHEVWSAGGLQKRFPWIADFLRDAREGQTARFEDASGQFALEHD